MPKTKKEKNSPAFSTHGKLPETPKKPATLAQLFGDKGLTKYGTLDPAIYEARLNEMTISELHLHCTQNGIKPIHNRNLIIKSLMSKFYKYVQPFTATIGVISEKPITINEELRKILARGK